MNKRILIIDDNIHVRSIYADILSMYGHVADTASDGEEALAHLRETTTLPDLIILDLEMPSIDGPEFRRLQLEDDGLKHIPILVSSARLDLELMSSQMGAQGYLRKPASIEEIVGKIQSVL